MYRKKIWIVGDETMMASQPSQALTSLGYLVEKKLEHPVDIDLESMPDLIVLNFIALGMPGLNHLVTARQSTPPIPVVAIAAPHQTRIVVEALKLGAADAIVAPVDPKDLVAAIEMVLQKEQRHQNALTDTKPPHRAELEALAFNSDSPKMAHVWRVTTVVARTDVPVLILGESGVGKEVLARFIHRHSRRADKPLVKVNCAALPYDLLESELFGYERGAFTGAVGEKPGKFELADKGTLILDEIGEMPHNIQAKLLHVLEDGEFSRLGGKRPVNVDVRVLALTNRNLEEAVPRGEFREDLYFRLNVVKIKIPPLRERKEDIPFLCEYFLKKHRVVLESSIDAIASEVIDNFARHDWPGNVRQLENAMKQYLIFPGRDLELYEAPPAQPENSPEITPVAAESPVAFDGAVPANRLPAAHDSVCLKSIIARVAEETERQMVLHILGQTKWNRRIAAQRLNICYKGLLNKLKNWQIEGRRRAA